VKERFSLRVVSVIAKRPKMESTPTYNTARLKRSRVLAYPDFTEYPSRRAGQGTEFSLVDLGISLRSYVVGTLEYARLDVEVRNREHRLNSAISPTLSPDIDKACLGIRISVCSMMIVRVMTRQ
jgi:hypothetical protein